MRKYKILLCVSVISMLFLNKVYALESTDSKWSTSQPVITEVSKGLDIKYEYLGDTKEEIKQENGTITKQTYSNFKVTITIPESYSEKQLNIDPNIFDVITKFCPNGSDSTFISMPGDNYRVNVVIINNSKYSYKYVSNSFKVYPDSEIQEYYSYKFKKNISNLEVTEKGVLFNGLSARTMNQYTRVINKALIDLLKEANSKDATDASLDKILKNKKDSNNNYYSGINDLNKYYLEYYNNLYNTNNNKLEDFSINQIKEIMGNYKSGYQTQLETNAELLALHFNFFYNEGISISTSETILTDNNVTEYSIGEHMRNNSLEEEYLSSDDNQLNPNKETSLVFNVHLSGRNLGNVYAYYDFMVHSRLTYIMPTSNLIVRYVDEDGNDLLSVEKYSEIIGSNYSTCYKEINNYELYEVNGVENGVYSLEDIIVTYKYKKKSNTTPVVNYVDTGLNNKSINSYSLGSIILFMFSLMIRKNTL